MKKVLLAGTALLGLAISAPASAELNLDLGGHFRGYGAFLDQDESDPDGAGPLVAPSFREFDFRRDTEIHFSGEATSDNGLTVGAHYEAFVGGDITTDEAYMYMAGNWGRFNFGSEDGAAYLLQVAAPSADSNVDGLRSAIQTVNSTGLATLDAIGSGVTGYTGSFSGNFSSNVASTGFALLDYDHADFQDTDRLTYLTPKWSGFQAGVSYAPEAGQNGIGNALSGMAADNNTNDFEDLWEIAARWDGEFEGFGISFGGGYSSASLENSTVAVANDFNDDIDTWNAGLNVAFRGFSVGAAYLNSDTSIDTNGVVAGGDADIENDTWVIGAAWDNGPYHVGVSYIDSSNDIGAADVDADRWTVGAGYTYGPGMSFRGAVAMGNVDDNTLATATVPVDEDFTQVTIGTDIQF